MSEGDPSLEEDSPHLLLEKFNDNVFPTKAASLNPLFQVNTPKFRQQKSDIQETIAFLNNAQKTSKAMSNFSKSTSDEYFDMEEQVEMKSDNIQPISMLIMSPQHLSHEEKSHSLDPVTRLPEESQNIILPNGEDLYSRVVEDIPRRILLPDVTGKQENNVNHCSIMLTDPAKTPSLYMSDGVRTVDFVLVWEVHSEVARTPLALHQREIYESNLEAEGLEIEREAPQNMNGLHFLKIHTPLNVLRRYSEILKLRMPMKEELCKIAKGTRHNAILNAAMFISKLPALKDVHTKTNTLLENVKSTWDCLMKGLYVDPDVFPERSHRFTAIYSRDKEYLFDVHAPCFWTASVRSRIVQFVLDRQKFSREMEDYFGFGIERLISLGTYSAAYPLHDGDLKTPGSMRYLLLKEWASVSKCIKYQPLDYVKDYFGVKIALYFAWLGFYTHMLIPAALVGLLCFIYSVSTLYTNVPSEDVCADNSNIKMCPLCDYWCDYWDLKETCMHARVTYLIDNPTTVFFAIFMSFWAALFLELWKRYSAEITHRWDLTGFDVHEEHPRPKYLARLAHVKRKQVNIVTNMLEPHVPFWRMRLPATVLSFSVVLLLVLLALATVLAVVLYRMSVLAALSVSGQDSVITSNAILFTSATAASINLCLICVLNYIYQFLAEYMTERELLRTQTEFDDSLTLKIYLLQFINYYASIFYIAFFKGKIIGHPGNYTRLFGYRQEECGPGGCLMELCIQLAIIMVGKQAVNTVVEMMLPYAYKWINLVRTLGRRNGTCRMNHFELKDLTKNKEMKIRQPLTACPERLYGSSGSYPSASRLTRPARYLCLVTSVGLLFKTSLQWVKDFKLVDFGHMGLFPEYLEMVLQYGFVTIFVAAFPLAPLFALLNNVLEMRLDAFKLLSCYRRPVPARVADIGVWYRILDSIGKLSVITNGFIIAFTSEFIPRMVYRLTISDDGSLHGYLNHTLAFFYVSDLKNGSAPHQTIYNETLCRFPDYREPAWSSERYQRTSTYWHVLGARLAFVVVFENVVAMVMIFVRWCIPDMSGELRDRIRREAYVINEIIIGREAQRARDELAEGRNVQSPPGPHDTESEAVGTWSQLMSTSLTGSDFDLACHAATPIDTHAIVDAERQTKLSLTRETSAENV